MSFSIDIIAPIIASAGALLASVLTSYISNLRKKRIKEEKKHVESIYKKTLETYFNEIKKSYPEIKPGDKWG